MSQDVLFASCFDDKFPPTNLVSSNKNSCWVTTGLYPQEVIINLGASKQVNKINITSVNINKILIESCEDDNSVSFRSEFEGVIKNNQDALQTTCVSISSGNRIKILKVVILEGYDNFAAISNIEVN
jgi:heat shock protein beta-11